MHKAPHILIALYDAHPEHAHFENAALLGTARSLGKALATAKMGVVARVGSPAITAAIETLAAAGVASVALSPATTAHEHDVAYRLPHVSAPMVFTGRGAIGADMVALTSGSALVVIGAHESSLANILAYAKGQESLLPVGILTEEGPSEIHERVRALYPGLTARLFVSHDPVVLVKEISDELRRRHLEGKHSGN